MSDFPFTFHFHALEKEMATHSSILAWRIPWTLVFWKSLVDYILWGHKESDMMEMTSVQSLSRVQFFVTSWTAAHQASLSIANSWSLLKLMSMESVMPSSHLILCRPLLPPSIFPSIRVFSNESVLLGNDRTHPQHH